VIQVLGWGLGLPLEILVIIALLRGGYRRYPIVFSYVLALFVSTLVDIPFQLQSFLTPDAAVIRLGARVYWIHEWILETLIFMAVLSLIDLATALSRSRRAMRVALSGGALLFAGLDLWIHYRPEPVKFGVWMTPWTRDLSVCATVLDLGLWMILIASRKRDGALLLICGALGMQFSAEAIGKACDECLKVGGVGRNVHIGNGVREKSQAYLPRHEALIFKAEHIGLIFLQKRN